MVDIAFTPVRDASNHADTTGYGHVPYRHAVSKYEINLEQYIAFLNGIAATLSQSYVENLYDEGMNGDNDVIENIIAGTGSTTASDSYRYSAATGPANSANTAVSGAAPTDLVPFVDWFGAARFINWLHNGAAEQASTETGAYSLNSAISGIIPGNAGAKATRSEKLPDAVNPPGTSNATSYNGIRPEQYKLIETGSYELSPSSFGTFDQAGKLWGWTGTNLYDNYIVHGGSRRYGLVTVESTQRRNYKMGYKGDDTGFGIATHVSSWTDLGALETAGLTYSRAVYEQVLDPPYLDCWVARPIRRASMAGEGFLVRKQKQEPLVRSPETWPRQHSSAGQRMII